MREFERGKYRPCTMRELKVMAECAKNGIIAKETARRLGRSKSVVQKWIKRMGLSQRKDVPYRSWSENEDAMIMARDKTDGEIAAALRTTTRAVIGRRYRLRKLGRM